MGKADKVERPAPDKVCVKGICNSSCDEASGTFYVEYEHVSHCGEPDYASTIECDCYHHRHTNCADGDCEQCTSDAYWDWYELEETRAKERRAGII